MNRQGMFSSAAARRRALLVVLLAGCLGPTVASAQATTYMVTMTDNSGSGSLRQAIMDSNTHPAGGTSTNLITFSIGSGAQTISPTSALPKVTAPVVIDGASQTGFENTPLIRLDGASAPAGTAGLTITAGSSAVQNLEITNFKGAGILLQTKGGDSVSGSYIGTDGTTKQPNNIGIESTSSENAVGGLSAPARDVISGNTNWGVLVTGSGATSNTVLGNYIGTDATGATALGNGQAGVELLGGTQGDFVGNTRAGARNVISGNGNDGISVVGSGTSRNLVQGNYLGTNAAGTAALPNAVEGVGVFGGATSNMVGGTTAAARNLISGNTGDGVGINGKGTSSNLVQGNRIGTNPAGTAALPNAGIGTAIYSGASGNTVGGTTAAARNLISGNGHYGVTLVGTGTSGNHVEGNFIGTNPAGNAAVGNDLEGVAIYDGATGNTVGGTTAGARNVISGNHSNGLAMSDSGTSGNLVEGNFIGTTAGGAAALANTGTGVLVINGASHNTIGGTVKGSGNRIAHNTSRGVHIDGSKTVGNRIEGNSIFANKTKVGIALTAQGNANQIAPTILKVATSGSTTKVTFKLPAGKYRVDVFANPSCADPEGTRFLGSPAQALASGTWTANLPKVPAGQGITLTATNTTTSNTSRFSRCKAVPK